MRRLGTDDYAVDAVTGAKALVGAWLCRRLEDGSVVRRRITETEAYCGEEDTACHAHKGRTARTDVMYAPGGCAYIYLCYGYVKQGQYMNKVRSDLDECKGRKERETQMKAMVKAL